MELRPGLRLESATCETQVVVVKAPKDGGDVDLRCGGAPMPSSAPAATAPPPPVRARAR